MNTEELSFEDALIKLENIVRELEAGRIKLDDAVAAYNPDDVTQLWLLENGEFIPFQLIEQRFTGKSLDGVKQMQATQNELIRSAVADNLQAQVDLAEHIEVIANKQYGDVGIKNIRKSRQRARNQAHIDYVKEVTGHD